MTKGKPKASGLGVRWRGDAVAMWRPSFLEVPEEGHACNARPRNITVCSGRGG